MSEQEHEHINDAINGMIGQLTVPMMKFRDPDIKEVHTHLLELAAWLDDNINDEA
jgi:hypothetical protein